MVYSSKMVKLMYNFTEIMKYQCFKILYVYNAKIIFVSSSKLNIFLKYLAVFLILKRFYKTRYPNTEIVLHMFVYIELKSYGR